MEENYTNNSEYSKLLLQKYNVFTNEKINFVDTEYLNLESQKYYSIMKSEFELENISGKGDEVSRLFRIIRWVNKFVPINNPIISEPQFLDGYSILKKVNEGNSLNCMGYSILTNDLLLSLGFKSKCIWCMSPYINDDECHVVNQVYLNQIKKWVMVDASFGHIPSIDDKFLDVIEFRTALYENKIIKLRKSEKFNFSIDETEKFIHYMYKNSFRFIFNTRCRFNINNGFYSLIPQNFDLKNMSYNGITNIVHNVNYLYT